MTDVRYPIYVDETISAFSTKTKIKKIKSEVSAYQIYSNKIKDVPIISYYQSFSSEWVFLSWQVKVNDWLKDFSQNSHL